jgi:hypothetical protein
VRSAGELEVQVGRIQSAGVARQPQRLAHLHGLADLNTDASRCEWAWKAKTPGASSSMTSFPL